MLINGKSIVDTVYPVGSIYLSVKDDTPMALFGGDWVQIENKFLLACGSEYELESEGGEKEHLLKENEMPSHYHTIHNHLVSYPTEAITHQFGLGGGSNPAGFGSRTTNVKGGDQPHNNMPPYLAVKVWKRVG